jgi:pilus assembly protein CpaF
MAGMSLPVRAIREQIASAVDLIVHLARFKDGSRRVTHITEVTGMEGEIVTLQDLYAYDYRTGVDQHGRHTGALRATGLRPSFMEHLTDQGIHLPLEVFGRGGGA